MLFDQKWDMEKALEVRYQEGWEEGYKEGLELGIQEFRAQQKIEMARMMLSDGLEPEKISWYVDLPLEKVMALKQ